MKYKFSKYNHLVEYSDDYIVFNTLTLSLILLENKYIRSVQENDIVTFLNQFNEDEINSLYENGIIVDKDCDEFKIIKDSYWYNKYKDDTLHVSIMTTLGCNFSCPYCFETRRNVRLTPVIEKAIINFIKEQAEDKKNIHIDWYGGEPLLNTESIERISNEILQYAESLNKNFYASITTNGYLLTNDVVDKLFNLRVKSAQITLDGPKD